MLNKICPECGITLRKCSDPDTFVCPKCLRSFKDCSRSQELNTAEQPFPEEVFKGKESLPDLSDGTIAVIFIMILVACVSFVLRMIPVTIVAALMIVITVKVVERTDRKPEQAPAAEEKQKQTAEPETTADFIRAFQNIGRQNFDLLPQTEHVVTQLQQLERKRRGLSAMLGTDHPFLQMAADAERYVLSNCRQIYRRFYYCDLSDPSLLRQHMLFASERLRENERVLADYENLVIEVTQMDDSTPVPVPCMDTVTDTLRRIRTGDEDNTHHMMMQ